MLAAEYEKQIGVIRDLYNIAEADLKAVGREENVLIVAGVNQCRYAGQHLVRALAATDRETVEEELAASNRHLRRAIYDINDAAIQYYLTQINAFRRRFPVNLNAIVPNYADIMDSVANAEQRIETKSRENHSNRELLYEQVREDIEVLRAAFKRLEMATAECSAEVDRLNRTNRTTWALIAVSFTTAAATVVRAIEVFL